MSFAWNQLVSKIRARLPGQGLSMPIHRGFCAVGITPQQIWVAASPTARGDELDCLVSCPCQKTDLDTVLEYVVQTYDLQGRHCSWILYPEQYHLFLMDSLPVPPAEFQAAIRWKLMELVPFPIEEALIDSFPVPAQKTHDPRDMMMVAVTRADQMKMGVNAILGAGLNLQGFVALIR